MDYKIDFEKKQIVVSSRDYLRACRPENNECAVLLELLKTYEGFAAVQKRINQSSKKETHRGLKYKKMEKIIRIMEGEHSEVMQEFLKKKDEENLSYPVMKEWFLAIYPNWREINENYKAKKKIEAEKKKAEAEQSNKNTTKNAPKMALMKGGN